MSNIIIKHKDDKKTVKCYDMAQAVQKLIAKNKE